MAEATPPAEPIAERDPGAPVPADAIDPELVKLGRAKPTIGIITALGVVILCVYFVFRLSADRGFAGEPEEPRVVTVADVAAGKIAEDSHVAIETDLVMAHAIRAVKAKGDPGLRVTPARGSSDKLWIVLDGTGWDPPTLKAYKGRLRKLSDLPFADAARDYAAKHPRPVFAKVADVRAALATNKVKTITGEELAVADTDRVAFDVVDPGSSHVIVTFTGETKDHPPLLDADAWLAQFTKLGMQAVRKPAPDQKDKLLGQARFDVAAPPADVMKRLETAKLWAARVEPVTRHYDLTWNELRTTGLPQADLDLVGFYVTRPIPGDAYALLIGEKPQDYWYVLPITVVLALIGLLFAWALVRAVRRDLVPTRA